MLFKLLYIKNLHIKTVNNYCKITEYLGFIYFLVAISINILLTIYGANNLIDSDLSSELVFSKLLAEEGRLISSNWFYPTELRIISAHLIYVPLANLFSNWTAWRICSEIICLAILLFSYYYLLKQLNVHKYFFFSAGFLLIPFSGIYYYELYLSLFYTPYIIISFLTIGLIFQYTNSKNKTQSILLMTIQCSLALFAGLGGFREIVQLYLPIVMGGFLLEGIKIIKNNSIKFSLTDSEKKIIRITLLSLIFASLGLAINIKVLSRIYSFMVWSNIVEWKYFDPRAILTIINDLLKIFGYSCEKIRVAIITNSFSLLFVFSVFFTLYIIKKSKTTYIVNFIACFLISNIFILLFLFSFTSMNYRDVYQLPVIVMFIPFLTLCINIFKNHILFKGLICFIIVTSLITGISTTRNYIKKEQTFTTISISEIKKISSLLDQNNYSFGYADFWNSNIITELTNGKIGMNAFGDFHDDMSNLKNVTETYPWLQSKKNVNYKPVGKTFILLNKKAYNTFYAKNKVEKKESIYNSDNFIVFGFSNYDLMMTELGTKTE